MPGPETPCLAPEPVLLPLAVVLLPLAVVLLPVRPGRHTAQLLTGTRQPEPELGARHLQEDQEEARRAEERRQHHAPHHCLLFRSVTRSSASYQFFLGFF